ncbi:hypothetical protein FRC17_006537, partial [Serendipita sp. 399]
MGVKGEWIPDYEWSEFQRAYALVSSRAFWVDAYHGLALVPVADAFNHTEENHVHLETDWQVCHICGSLDACEHDEEVSDRDHDIITIRGLDERRRAEHTFDMVANRPIRAGEEVYNTYDSRGISNVDLLCRYGFILEGNAKDVVSFEEGEVSRACGELLSEPYLLENTIIKRFVQEYSSFANSSVRGASRTATAASSRNHQKIDVATGPMPVILLDRRALLFSSIRRILEEAGVVQQVEEDEWSEGGSYAKEDGEAAMYEPTGVTAAVVASPSAVSELTTTGAERVQKARLMEDDEENEEVIDIVGWETVVASAGVNMAAERVGKGSLMSSSAADAARVLQRRKTTTNTIGIGGNDQDEEVREEKRTTSSPPLFSSWSFSPPNVFGVRSGSPNINEDRGRDTKEGKWMPPDGDGRVNSAQRMEIDAEGLASRALWTRLVCEVLTHLSSLFLKKNKEKWKTSVDCLSSTLKMVPTDAQSRFPGGGSTSHAWASLSSSLPPMPIPLPEAVTSSSSSPFSRGKDRNRPIQPRRMSDEGGRDLGLERREEDQGHGLCCDQDGPDVYFDWRGGRSGREAITTTARVVGGTRSECEPDEGVGRVRDFHGLKEDEYGHVWVEKCVNQGEEEEHMQE